MVKMKYVLSLILGILILSGYTAHSQSLFDKVKKIQKKVQDAVDDVSNPDQSDILKDPKAKVKNLPDITLPLQLATPLSELNTITIQDSKVENYPWKIGNNMLLDIGIPAIDGYYPQWHHITYLKPLPFEYKNMRYNFKPEQTNGLLAMYEHNDKAYLHFSKLSDGHNCDCVAELVIPDGKAVIINEKVQRFKLTNFKKVITKNKVITVTDEPCHSAGMATKDMGGYEGSVALSAGKDASISMAVQLQSYMPETTNKPREASGRFTSAKVSVDNLVPLNRFYYDSIVAKSETEFLTYLFDFFINSKEAYTFANISYMPNSLKIADIKRDSKGGLQEVLATYRNISRSLAGHDTVQYSMLFYFENKLLYRISYPDEPVFDHLPNRKGRMGKLFFTPAQLARMDVINESINKKTAITFEENRKKSWEELIKKQKAYAGKPCAECLTKNVTVEQYKYEEIDYDEKNRQYTEEKTGYQKTITINNVCDKPVLMVGIEKAFNSKKGIYYKDATRTFPAGYKSSFMYAPELALLGITNNIDFESIKPEYDDKNVPIGTIQYLKIIYK